MNNRTDRLRLLLLSSIYLVLVGMFFSLESAPPNWVWIPFWASLIPALLALGIVVNRLFSGSQPSNTSETTDHR
jgi:hypothetical membrane protein